MCLAWFLFGCYSHANTHGPRQEASTYYMYYGVQTVRLCRDRWFQSTMFWWFASSLPCKQNVMSHHPTKCWRVCYIRYQSGHLGSMLFQAVFQLSKTVSSCFIHAGSIEVTKTLKNFVHPSLPASWLAPWSASRRYRWQSFELFCQVDGDPWLGFSTFMEIYGNLCCFFLGHNSKYDLFFLAFQVFAPFTWYKTCLLP